MATDPRREPTAPDPAARDSSAPDPSAGTPDGDAAVRDALLSIERALWTGGTGAYMEHLDASCLVAFTEMAGVYSRDEVAGMVEAGPRWRELEIEAEGLVRPTPGVAILTYRVSAVRDGEDRYRARVSSAYVDRDGAWAMAFHQQTPLES